MDYSHALHRDALASALAAQTVAGADAAAHDDSMAMSPGAVPLPPQSLRGRVGAPDVGNFLYVCDQWAQVLSHSIGGQGESTDRKSTRLNSSTNAHLVCRL